MCIYMSFVIDVCDVKWYYDSSSEHVRGGGGGGRNIRRVPIVNCACILVYCFGIHPSITILMQFV